VDGSFLGLVSDQGLRTTIIAGRPDIGQPDWKSDVSGRPLTAQDVSDVVAWLAAQRPATPGQPYPGGTRE
jgi:cytochrome c oxidase cbb3-type subunit 3/ubiquinol-cytochrome c reductase cytochrome c subunit